MVQGWIDFYVFVGLFLLFIYVLIKIKSTRAYKAYLNFQFLAMMWPLSQFTLPAALDSRVQWLLLLVSFVTISFLAYVWLIFTLVMSRRMNRLSLTVKVWLVIPPILSTVVMLTNPYHHLFVEAGDHGFAEREYGPLLSFIVLYSLIYFGVASFLIIKLRRIQTDRSNHKQLNLYILGLIIISISGLVDVYLNVWAYPRYGIIPGSTSIGLLAAVCCFILALRDYRELTDTSGDQQFLINEMNEKNRALLDQNEQLLKLQHELYEVNHKLEQMSVTDDLTQCFNRRFFYQHLIREIDIEQRYQMDFSIIMFDLDNFKSINDAYGHPVGDAVLVGLSELVRNTLRKSDILARIGGEEFVLYLPYTAGQSALRMAERIRDIVERHDFSIPKGSIRTTISMGLVSVEQHLDLIVDSKKFLENLMTIVDKVLYEAKEAGRNRIVAAPRIGD
ncbi:MAG: diguanylate cyclase [Paenibacillaceae bacterium]